VSGAPGCAARWDRRHTAIVLVALLVGGAGAVTLPLDDHEVLVVQTAQEMRERHDWVVPYFLGAPRLNKPPFSYWLVAGLADSTASPRVTPWQGRAPSIVGGAGVVALTMLVALALTDAGTAVLAGLIAASSVGLFRYAHSARPDMLYAFWCTAMLAAYCREWRPYLLWLGVALATLTKGPQVPAMVLAAIVIVERRRGTALRALGRRLHPLAGIGMVLTLTVPWWWAVHRALGGRGLAGTQLGGSLLAPSWSHVLDPYFFYRPLALLLPSVVVVLPALAWRCRPDDPRGAVRTLAPFVIVPAIAFTLGPQRRPHYMLPALAPMCILLALVTSAVLETARARARWLRRAAALVLAVTIALEVALAGTPILWSKERFVVAELGALAAGRLPATTPLFALYTGAAAPSYYAGRPIRYVRSINRIVSALETAPGGAVGLLTEREALARFPPTVVATVLGGGGDPKRQLVLAELRPRAPE